MIPALKLRPVLMTDAKLLFDWRNDPLTRAMSKNQEPIEWDEHMAWLKRRREQSHFFIATQNGVPVATFRIDGGEISYTTAPEHRGERVCTRMLEIAKKIFGPLRAEIYERNVASIAAAKRAEIAITIL